MMMENKHIFKYYYNSSNTYRVYNLCNICWNFFVRFCNCNFLSIYMSLTSTDSYFTNMVDTIIVIEHCTNNFPERRLTTFCYLQIVKNVIFRKEFWKRKEGCYKKGCPKTKWSRTNEANQMKQNKWSKKQMKQNKWSKPNEGKYMKQNK